MPEISEKNRILRQDDENYSAVTGEAQHLHSTMLEAETIMRQSLKKSHEIISRVEEEAKTAIENAAKNGFGKGYGSGFERGLEEGKAARFSAKQQIVDELSVMKNRLPECCKFNFEKNQLIDEAFKLAKIIIDTEIAKNENSFFGLYSKAASHISNVEKATVKSSARNCDAIQQRLEMYKNVIDGLNSLTAVPIDCDDGCCILETPLGTIDTSVNLQLERARNIISPKKAE